MKRAKGKGGPMKTTPKAARFSVPKAGWDIDHLATTRISLDGEEKLEIPSERSAPIRNKVTFRRGQVVKISTSAVSLRGRVKKLRREGDGSAVILSDVVFEGPWRSFPSFPTAIGEVEMLPDRRARTTATGFSGRLSGYERMRHGESRTGTVKRVVSHSSALSALARLHGAEVRGEPVGGVSPEELERALRHVPDQVLTENAAICAAGHYAPADDPGFRPSREAQAALARLNPVLQHLYEGFSGRRWRKREGGRPPRAATNPLKGLRRDGLDPSYVRDPDPRSAGGEGRIVLPILVNDRRSEGLTVHWVEMRRP